MEIVLPEGVSVAEVIEQLQRNGFLEKTKHPKSLSSLLKLIKELISKQSEDTRLQKLFTITIKMGLTITNLPSVSVDDLSCLVLRCMPL